MHTALVSAGTSTSSFAFSNLVVVIVLLAIGWPLLRKLRRSVSEKRKQRWIEQGLMNPPTVGPEPQDPSD